MIGEGSYPRAREMETLHGRILSESTVHIFCESKVLSSSSYSNIKLVFSGRLIPGIVSSFNRFLFIADNEKELKGHRAINKGKREGKNVTTVLFPTIVNAGPPERIFNWGGGGGGGANA